MCPYRLVPPKAGRSPYWYVRGTEHGIALDRSTKVSRRQDAQKFLVLWREEAQRAALSGSKREVMTFAAAAISYMQSGRSKLFLAPLIRHFGEIPIDQIDQAALDRAGEILGHHRKPQTNNRLVYTPTLAILRHAGIERILRRPKVADGSRRVEWLRPDDAFRLLSAAGEVDPRLGALLTFLLYTGVRLSEALRLEWADIDLQSATALIRRTKNGQPITAHLNAEVVAGLANLPRERSRTFGLTKCGRLYDLLGRASDRASVPLPDRSAFHILRHTHATWRRLYTGADTSALVATGLWKSRNAAAVYEHVDTNEEARKSDMLPTPSRVRGV